VNRTLPASGSLDTSAILRQLFPNARFAECHASSEAIAAVRFRQSRRLRFFITMSRRRGLWARCISRGRRQALQSPAPFYVGVITCYPRIWIIACKSWSVDGAGIGLTIARAYIRPKGTAGLRRRKRQQRNSVRWNFALRAPAFNGRCDNID
jgi:hypothetical protein